MPEKANIQLPTDGSGKRFRLLTIQEVNADGATIIDVNQEVVAVADEDGNLYKLIGGRSLKTGDPTLEDLMKGMIRRLDILCGMVDDSYSPIDELGEDE